MENPLDPGHLIKWKGYFNTWKSAPRRDDGIWIINPFIPLPIRDSFPFNTRVVMDLSYRCSIPSIRKLMQLGKVSPPDVVWAAKPGGAVFKKIFPGSKLVMQVVDYYPAFRGEYIKAIEKHDYQSADHVFLIGNAMYDYVVHELDIDEKKVSVLGQGVSMDHYQKCPPIPLELQPLSGAIAIWVGVLEKLDMPMMMEVARTMKSVGGYVVLIGPDSPIGKLLSNEHENVLLLGPKSPLEVPAYLMHSDIGLMLYDQRKSDVYYGQNPLKLYEYAAAGLAILSTPHREYDFLSPPVARIERLDAVAPAILEAIANKEEYAVKARAFAKSRDWENVYQTAKDKIMELFSRD
jgi:hypothetical protein